jgi:hypothetical protein
MRFIVERPCFCASTSTPGYVGLDGHSCEKCCGDLAYEIETDSPRRDDIILKENEPDYSDWDE